MSSQRGRGHVTVVLAGRAGEKVKRRGVPGAAPPGAASGFTRFYEHEAPRLVRSVTLVVGDAAVAEDAVAEAFARAWSRWSQVRRHDRPVAWVMRVAINESRSRFRRRAVERRRGHEVAQAPVVHDPDASSGWALWDAVRRLGTRERTLIALRYVADLSQPEIADLLGIPPGTVASGLHRARQQLERSLSPIPEEDWQ